MALKSTIFKADLQINDLDRHYYASHALTIAQHPSETDERMMMRVLAFALNADETLIFGKGLSTDDEPDLWRKDLTGAIEQWIDVGLPEERWLRKASGRSERVLVYAYGRTADLWWTQNKSGLGKLASLAVYQVPVEASQALADRVERTMQLQCTIQDGQAWMLIGDASIDVTPVLLKAGD